MLQENNLSGQVNLIAVNTDLAALNSINVENKILIGENLTNGYGAGSDPSIGYQAAQESEGLLRSSIMDSDIVIITAGFGGGTGIDDIKEPIHAYITLSNDLLLAGLGESVGLFSAFNQSNEVLKNLLIALVQMLNETGYVNVDKNDFSTILSFEGESILGVGKANSEEEAYDALDQALNNPLVSIANIDTAKGIIFQLFCKSEPKLSTYNGLIDHIRTRVTNQSVLIVPGVTLDPNLSSEIEILIIGSGICSIKPESIKDVVVNEENNSELEKVVESDEPAYIDDELSFINQGETMTDIPAITRKLMAINRD